jgi:hypothetical protein
MMPRWNGPVAATTLVASIAPAEVSAWKPVPSGLRCSAVTATPQRIGAAMWAA